MPRFVLELAYRATRRVEITADDEDEAVASARHDYHYHLEGTDDFSTLDDAYVIAELDDREVENGKVTSR